MNRKYVEFNTILNDPAKYSKHWIQSTGKLKTVPYYSTQSGGGKYLLDLVTPHKENVKLAIWEAPPSWIPYPETSEYLLNILSGNDEEALQILRLYRPSEMVYFEGYLILQNDVIWINIERILIASPDIAVGPREIIGILSCQRKYYLEYVKNVGGNILKRPNKNITRGNIIHEILEHVACDGSLQSLSLLSYGEKKEKIRELIRDQFTGKYRMDAALHLLAKTPLNDVEKDVTNRLISAFGDNELNSLFNDKTIRTEWRINRISGFSGIIDFLVDGHPVELKSATRVSSDHILQLKVYLVSTLLEFGIDNGYLIYPTRTDAHDGEGASKIHQLSLTNEDIDEILYARHLVLLQRTGIVLPTTLNRNCADCRYHTEAEHPLRNFWPACQYYCQTERHWNCYEVDSVGQISDECPLLDTCPVRLQYFAIEGIDHFNKLRRAIIAENEELFRLSRLLRVKSDKILRACGQKVKNLTLKEIDGNLFCFQSSESMPCLDCTTGDQVILSTEDGLRYTGTYMRSGGNFVFILFSGTLQDSFFEKNNRFTLTRDYSENQSMRSLLKVIDYIQRGIRHPIQPYSKGKISEKQNINPYRAEDVVKALDKKYLCAVQTTHQTNTIEQCSDIITNLKKPYRILLVFRDSVEIDSFIHTYPVKHELLVIDRVQNFEKGVKVHAISGKNSCEDIAEKIELSPIILTRKGFLQSSNFFEMLQFTKRKIPFDYVIATNSEEYYEPQIQYLRNLGTKMVLIGDAFRAYTPIRSSEARKLGLGFGPFRQIVRYDSYFISDHFSVYSEPFSYLPCQIVNAFKNTSLNVPAKEHDGSIAFLNVNGKESGDDNVHFISSLKMSPSGGSKFRVLITPQDDVSLSCLNEMMNKLALEKFDLLKEGNRITIGETEFVVKALYPLGEISESGENVEVVVEIPIQFSETLEELMYSNHSEAEKIIDLIQNMDFADQSRCAVITPFINQSSCIRSLLFENNLTEIPVLLPYQAGKTSYDIVIVSFVCAGKERILRYPLTQPEVLYSILTSATEQLILVGSEETMKQSRILREIIDAPETKRW